MKPLWFWTKLCLLNARRPLILLVILMALQPVMTWWQFGLTRRIVDSLAAAEEWRPIALLAVTLGAIHTFNLAFNQLEKWSNDTIGLRIERAAARYVYEHLSIDTVTRLETPEYAHDLHLVKSSLTNVQFMIGAIIRIVRHVVLVLSYASIIAGYNGWFIPALLLFAVPAFVFEQQYADRREQNQQRKAQDEITVWHTSDMLTGSRYIREMIIFGIRPFLLRKWEKAITRVHKTTGQLHRYELLWRFLYGLSTPACLVVTQCAMIYFVSRKTMTIGDYFALTAAVSSTASALNVIANNTVIMKQVLLMSRRLTGFLERYTSSSHTHIVHAPSLPAVRAVEARGLCFRYPTGNRLILRNIDLKLELGQVLALVGENGSGKSTLAGILFGLHEVDRGMLYINEHDVNDVNRTELFRQLSVISQDFIRYPLSLLENITLTENSPASRELLEWIEREYPYLVPSHLHRHPDMLLGSHLIGSSQLSGGQWQRIAAARALVKSAPFLLLDEATSEMDPETSAMFLQKLLEQRQGLTTVIVTHLMPIAAMADKIVVMHEGAIAESGSHEALMKRQGKYWAMSQEQRLNRTEEMKSDEYELQSIV